MDVQTGIDLYLRERAGVLRKQTLDKHRMTLNIFARDFAGRHLGTITPAELIAWRNSLRLKDSSRNKYMDRVAAFYRHLVRMDYLPSNPTDKIDPLDEQPARRVRLDPKIIPAMLGTARHPRDKALIATAVELLLRGGELSSLRVGDVLNGRLRVHVSKMRGVLSEDEMAISAPLEGCLRSWLKAYRAECGLVSSGSFLFPQLRTRLAGDRCEYFLAPDSRMAHPEQVVQYALKAAGAPVEAGTGVHTVRRSCARLLFDALVDVGHADPLGHVSSLMHHSSRKTTELYLGVTGDRVARNKLVVSTGTTPLSIALARVDETTSSGLSSSVVYQQRLHSV